MFVFLFHCLPLFQNDICLDLPADDSGAGGGSLEVDNDANEDLVESGAEEEESSGTEISDEELVEKLSNVLEQVKIKVYDNLQNDEVKKAAKSMIKNFEKGVKGNVQTFSKTLFSVGKELTAPTTAGAKRKNNGMIAVQQSTKGRRVFKHRGSQPAPAGAKVKDLEYKTQMLTEADDGVYHSLPKQKKQNPKQVQSLNAAVQANRAGNKKH